MRNKEISVLVNLKFEEHQITNFRRQEHLGIGYIAASARQQGHEVKVINAQFENLDMAHVLARIKEIRPKVVGLSLYEMQLKQSINFILQLKKLIPSVIIVVGGHYASFNYEELLQGVSAIDIVIRGEGEYSFPSLLQEIKNSVKNYKTRGASYKQNGSIINNGYSKVADNLDLLAYPVRKTLDRKDLITNISASRGCQANCSFCSTVALDKAQKAKKIRIRDPRKVVDEMQYLVEEQNAYHFFFTDDNFLATELVKPGWIENFTNEVIQRNLDVVFNFDCRVDDVSLDAFKLLKSAGLIGVFLGVESNSEDTLKLYNKKTSKLVNTSSIKILRKLRVPYWIGNIMFHPLATLNDIIDDLNFFSEIDYVLYFNYSNPVSLLAGRLSVYKGTPIYDKLKKQGVLKTVGLVADYEFKDSQVQNIYDFLKLWTQKIVPFVEVDTVFLIEQANKLNNNKLAMRLHILSRRYMKLDFDVFKEAVEYINQNLDINPSSYFKEVISKRQKALDDIYMKITDIRAELI